jgi:hypothetical protein
LLTDLPNKLPNISEKVFLAEALNCYRVQAFRATIVMAWNLAFDHLLNWILADAQRILLFNQTAKVRYPKKDLSLISDFDGFSELKEAEIIEVCRSANILSKNVVEVLREKLKRRNMAAHPSQLIFTQSQADDVITDLVNNVMLPLA